MNQRPRNGPRRQRRGLKSPARAPAAFLAALALACIAAPRALGWSDQGHFLITEESVRRLPDPLRKLLTEGENLTRLQIAAAAPDEWRKPGAPQYSPAEKPRHFFDIDGITPQGYPYKDFPRSLAGIEKPFGAKLLDEKGRAPWAIRDSMRNLVDALIEGRTEDLLRTAGEAAHYAADIHMPFHTTDNYDGQLTGNSGIHAALEVGLVNRYKDLFSAEIQKDRQEVLYLDRLDGAVIEWIIQANGRVPLLLEADTAARKRTGYNPKEFEKAKKDEAGKVVEPSDLDDLDSKRAKPYYTALKEELDKRGDPLAVQMRDASAHVARLLYTAWTDAGKPLTLAASPAKPAAEPTALPTWLLVAGFAIIVLALLPRRRRAPK